MCSWEKREKRKRLFKQFLGPYIWRLTAMLIMEKSPKKKIPRMMNLWKILIMGATSSTHDFNDHSPIQKEEVESRNTTIIDGKTYVVYESDDDYDFFVHPTPNSETIDTLNEKSTCEERKDYDNLLMEDSDFFSDEEDLVIEETNECLNKSSSENDDTCDVRMEVSSSTEDPVIQEFLQDCFVDGSSNFQIVDIWGVYFECYSSASIR
ncbi:uncharacterized protein LOC113274057 [Papaver somniferum]|uniref:uncharacterized protein LOC113274057 n=1 Tax=Papaver somniferum TaxID=3469 RepID=UPI000E6FE787|nr:uncharacterized protein LOC113274057 [Papaver somniferum]